METSHKEKLKNGKVSKYTNDSSAVRPPAFQIICSISDNTTKFTCKASENVLKWKNTNVLSYTRRKIKSNGRVMRLTIFEKSYKTKRKAHQSEKDTTISIWINNTTGDNICLLLYSSLLGGLRNHITYWTSLLFCSLHQRILQPSNVMQLAGTEILDNRWMTLI